MTEKAAIVTGGNRGLGLLTARKLAARGYHVVLTARSAADGESALAQIRAAVPGAKVECLALDLASFASIRAFADAFHKTGLPLNLLVNNAGVMTTNPKPGFTVEGWEQTFGTNHLGTFLLTHLLLGDLERAAPSRVVVVSSAMHKKGVGPGPGPDFDYDNLKTEKSFHPTIAYRNSKLANLWFAFELARRLREKNVTVIAVSPGWVPETAAPGMSSAFQRFLFRRVMPLLPIARTPDQGSDNTVFAATDPAMDKQSGSFFEDQKLAVLSDDSKDEAQAKRLWDASCRWTGIETYGVV
ncbi:MAG: SDR family NAD(P)-dependent oxidoreductase [Deltaproteobacteria bacterium]